MPAHTPPQPSIPLDFVIAGVQKGGTTALHTLLRAHPALSLSQPKELHIFNDDRPDWRDHKLAQLDAAFPEPGRLRGEATPVTTYWPNALARLKTHNPAVRLIVLVRHPACRARAHRRVEYARGAEHLTFAEAIAETGRSPVRAAPGGVHPVFSYVERGFYAGQLARVYARFPADNVLVLRTDTLWRAPARTVRRIEAFLGVAHRLVPERRYIAPASTAAAMPAEPFRHLLRIYDEDIAATAEIAGIDLADWRQPAYREPMAPAPPAPSPLDSP